MEMFVLGGEGKPAIIKGGKYDNNGVHKTVVINYGFCDLIPMLQENTSLGIIVKYVLLWDIYLFIFWKNIILGHHFIISLYYKPILP